MQIHFILYFRKVLLLFLRGIDVDGTAAIGCRIQLYGHAHVHHAAHCQLIASTRLRLGVHRYLKHLNGHSRLDWQRLLGVRVSITINHHALQRGQV